MAESMAIIPMDEMIAPECVKIVPAAVATGAGRSSSTSAPTLPISAILSYQYSETIISITSRSDLRISAGSFVSATGSRRSQNRECQ